MFGLSAETVTGNSKCLNFVTSRNKYQVFRTFSILHYLFIYSLYKADIQVVKKDKFLCKNGYPARRRSLVDDARFETLVVKQTKQTVLDEARQRANDSSVEHEIEHDDKPTQKPEQQNNDEAYKKSRYNLRRGFATSLFQFKVTRWILRTPFFLRSALFTSGNVNCCTCTISNEDVIPPCGGNERFAKINCR
ncbi:hypothetical protein NQ318_007355 [Aromia moschata]|uniref:Uncharacterized protein n=1 Tax=Aromia moschata TaxID=1265417 RepID=A0AAV8Z0W2_9CUCU|nr:hypothetical protein NQ318_007355 [Aromia moschata]